MGRGFLVPDHYVGLPPSRDDMNLASIVWGLSLAVAVYSGTQGVRQTIKAYRRGHKFSSYVLLIWAEWIASVVISVISWCFLRGYIGPSFQFFFITLCLWTVQIQAIMQIIINRIRFLVISKKIANRLKWGVFSILLLINISVFIIWIPARLQISERWIHINNIWDRCEKGIFLLIDLCLNIYFIYLVRHGLIANGLTKYIPLFRFNLAMICLSMTMDALIIGVMSLPKDTLYIQFHPLAYLVKLHIEMNMAELIAKIVKADNPFGDADRQPPSLKATILNSTEHSSTKPPRRASSLPPSMTTAGKTDSAKSTGSAMKETDHSNGILKTTSTHVFFTKRRPSKGQPDGQSESSSTRQLKREASSTEPSTTDWV